MKTTPDEPIAELRFFDVEGIPLRVYRYANGSAIARTGRGINHVPLEDRYVLMGPAAIAQLVPFLILPPDELREGLRETRYLTWLSDFREPDEEKPS